VGVRRNTSATHQFLAVRVTTLRRVDCPKGWMSPRGYARYLRITLGKMLTRLAQRRTTGSPPRGGASARS